jgi:hypothetical protein
MDVPVGRWMMVTSSPGPRVMVTLSRSSMDSPWLNMAHFVDRQRRLSNLFFLSRHGFHANNQLDGGNGGGRMECINKQEQP